VDFEMSEVMASVNRFGLSMIGISVIMILIVMLIVVVICRKTFSHLTHMARGLEQIAMKGDLQLPPDIKQSAVTASAWSNEIGVCARAVGGLLTHLEEQERTLSAVASGDLSLKVHVLSDRDVMGNTMAKMVDRLNEMFAGIHAGASQVLAGSKQIAEGSQSVASGSSEQAATVERLSATITTLADTTGNNAQMADEAAALSTSVKKDAEKGNDQMEQMLQAVSEINDASRNIEKVIKVIDEIAFQTNILALNAAVEAARAGQHGKGFAVVAEEVRSLASKSSEAAKDTGNLITTSMEKAALGSKIAEETSESLHGIVEGVNKSAVLVSKIARVSGEQAASIDEIKNGVNQVVGVVAQNSAVAQQSSAASEEMSGQADMLEGMVAQFRLRDGGIVQRSIASSQPSPRKQPARPERTSYMPNGGEYGKY
jgi:methyl-accepting chemotaxis protein